MAAELLTDASRATDANSNPYAGATWNFYQSGTLTPQNVFANADLSTSLGAVVTADAAGRFVPIYFDASKSYRGILKTASGTTLPGMDIDPVNSGVIYQLGLPGGSSAIGFLQAGAGAVPRPVQDKLRETVSLKDFGAAGDGVTDDTAYFQAAVDSGARRILASKGEYLISGTIVVTTDGITIEGDDDFETVLWATGSGPLFKIGDDANNITQHVTIRNFSYGGKPSFTGTTFIRVKRCFQTYLERLRYKSSEKSPTEAVIVLDNNDGTSEQPVRVTIRDCYFDGADYAAVPGVPAPIAIWNTGGIQTLVENTHIQDCEIGCKLGVNPAVDTQYYDAGHPNDDDFYDFYFVNNSRYQVGDRGGTTTNARAFDIHKGSGVHLSNAQFYLNNNGPTPALANQRLAVFNRTGANFGLFTMNQCVVNCNARADYIFKLAANVQVKRLAINASEFGGLVGSKGLIEMGASAVVQAVIDPSNVFDNANNFGAVDQRTNTAISPYDLGTACNHYYQATDGASRNFTAFSNGTIGVNYVMQFEITGGSSVTINTANPNAFTGIILDGFSAGSVALRNGDTLIVNRGPLAAVTGGYYRARLIRGGAPFFGVLTEYADDAAAAAGGIVVGQLYKTGSVVKQRVA
jgi:hypothetical protein